MGELSLPFIIYKGLCKVTLLRCLWQWLRLYYRVFFLTINVLWTTSLMTSRCLVELLFVELNLQHLLFFILVHNCFFLHAFMLLDYGGWVIVSPTYLWTKNR